MTLAVAIIPAMSASRKFHRRHPPPGRRSAPPDDRLQRMIQYAAAVLLDHRRLEVLDRQVKPGDDGCGMGLEP
jgi:hypothetical protein